MKVLCSSTGYVQARLMPAHTPFIDESKDVLEVRQDDSIREGEEVGELAHKSTSVLMTIVYMARFAGFGILRAVRHLTLRLLRGARHETESSCELSDA